MKKNKLYTANKWNRPAFMPKEENIFWPGGVVATGNNNAFMQRAHNDLSQSLLPQSSASLLSADTMSGIQNQMAQQNMQDYLNSKNAFGISKANNPFSKVNLNNTLKTAGTGLATAGIGMLGNVAGNAIAGGKTSGIGNAVGSIGSMALGAAGTAIGGPLGGAIGSAVGNVLGGLTNAAFGSKLNEENIANVENNINNLDNSSKAMGNSLTQEDLLSSWGNTSMGFDFDDDYIGEDGWFSSAASDKAEELRRRQEEARKNAVHNLNSSAKNIDTLQDMSVARNFAAFGGSLNVNKKGNRMNRMTQMPAINTFGHGGCFNPFALGGDTEVPQDNTKVFKPMMLPIQRQQNFSDSEYFWDAGKEYPAGLWKHKDGTFHTTGSYGKDIILTQEEADSIIRATKAKNRREKLRKAMENHKQNTYANGGQMYSVGQTYDVSEEEANRLKAMGYEFTVVS